MGVKSSGSKSSMSATTSILSKSRTAPTTWYLPVRSSARAVLRPRPDDVPVTTTSFLSPNFALAAMSRCMSPTLGILKFASCLKAAAVAATARSLVSEPRIVETQPANELCLSPHTLYARR